jgi:hypothetical protein
MNKIIYTILTLACIFLYSCKPTADEAGDYNDKLASIQIPIITATDEVEEAVYSYDKEEMYASLSKIEKQVDKSIEAVNKMSALGGKTEFKDATLGYFKAIKEGMVAEMRPIMTHYAKPVTETTEADDERAEKLMDANIDRVSKADEAFYKAQEAQAKEYGYTIESKPKF